MYKNFASENFNYFDVSKADKNTDHGKMLSMDDARTTLPYCNGDGGKLW